MNDAVRLTLHSPANTPLRLQQILQIACELEVRARKPGNVHPQASFPDLDWRDFICSARVVAPILAQTASLGIGRAILDSVRATRTVAASNTNLGMVLLLAPLCAVPEDQSLSAGIKAVLTGLTRRDADLVYEAIRLAVAGGLGVAGEGDVSTGPSGTLREMMCLAADRDSIAAEYARGFPITLDRGLPWLQQKWQAAPWEEVVIGLHLELMATVPDTLIARKCGPAVAREAADRAAGVIDAGWPESLAGATRLHELDAWLRADGHRRNPGTTADLVAASLFAVFRENHEVRRSALALAGILV